MMASLPGILAMAAATPTGFSCVASGVEAIAPVTADQACAAIQRAVEQALGDPRGISIALTVGKAIVKADVTDARSGTARALPTLYRGSLDRAPDAGTIEALARAIGAALRG